MAVLSKLRSFFVAALVSLLGMEFHGVLIGLAFASPGIVVWYWNELAPAGIVQERSIGNPTGVLSEESSLGEIAAGGAIFSSKVWNFHSWP